MNEDEVKDYLDHRPYFSKKAGNDDFRELMKELGDPQNGLKFIHVAGTNGKGSCCAMIAKILEKAGYRCGLYTSPHLVDYKERIRINEEMIASKDFCLLAEKVKEACEKLSYEAKFFEFLTAIAFLYYQEKNCDIIVLETGLGGRLDATNIIQCSEVSILMNIGLEHTAILGDTLEAIAAEKAGIIKENGIVLSYDNLPCVKEVFRKAAKEKNASLSFSDHTKLLIIEESLERNVFDYKNYHKMEVSLRGHHQFYNAAVVLDCVDILKRKGYAIDERAIREGLRDCNWEARFSLLCHDPLFILDGGHNLQCAKALFDTLEKILKGQKFLILCGILKDKDYRSILEMAFPYGEEFYTLTPPSQRAVSADELAEIIKEMGGKALPFSDTKEALIACLEQKMPVLAFGSLYLAGDILSCFVKAEKEALRRKMRQKRTSISEEERKAMSACIVSKIKENENYRNAKNIMIYKAVKGEVDLSALEEEKDKIFAYPYCFSENEMIALVPSGKNAFQKGRWGIEEPLPEKSEEMKEIDLIIVPLLAYDSKGDRLGNGRAYYDRFINGRKTLGVAFSFQEVEEIPKEEHDLPLDEIISDR